MVSRRGSAGLRGSALLVVLLAAACLPTWVRRAPSAVWDGDLLVAEATGGSEDVSFPLVCDLARRKAEKSALEIAGHAWATRFGARPPDFAEQNFELVGQARPSEQSCYVLIRFTARPAPSSPSH